jgi:hypothetical protein
MLLAVTLELAVILTVLACAAAEASKTNAAVMKWNLGYFNVFSRFAWEASARS